MDCVQNARAPSWPQEVESQRKNATRPSPETNVEKRDRGKLPTLCSHTADGAGRVLKKDPKSDAENWEKETDCLESRINIYAHNYLRCYAKKSSLCNGMLGMTGATEQRVGLKNGMKSFRSMPYGKETSIAKYSELWEEDCER